MILSKGLAQKLRFVSDKVECKLPSPVPFLARERVRVRAEGIPVLRTIVPSPFSLFDHHILGTSLQRHNTTGIAADSKYSLA